MTDPVQHVRAMIAQMVRTTGKPPDVVWLDPDLHAAFLKGCAVSPKTNHRIEFGGVSIQRYDFVPL